MITQDGIADDTAKYARQSLQKAAQELSHGDDVSTEGNSVASSEPISRQAWVPLEDTWECKAAREEFIHASSPHPAPEYYVDGADAMKNMEQRSAEDLQHLQPLANLLEVEVDDVISRLKAGRAVQFVPVVQGPIQLVRSERSTVLGILALSKLQDSLPCVGNEEVAELEPGKVLFFDGDETAIWRGTEKGFGILLSARKATYRANR